MLSAVTLPSTSGGLKKPHKEAPTSFSEDMLVCVLRKAGDDPWGVSPNPKLEVSPPVLKLAWRSGIPVGPTAFFPVPGNLCAWLSFLCHLGHLTHRPYPHVACSIPGTPLMFIWMMEWRCLAIFWHFCQNMNLPLPSIFSCAHCPSL